MEATDERAVLTRELDRVLGPDASAILMTHLPHGRSDDLATRQDIVDLRDELREDLERFATKEDLRSFARKEDLAAYATQEALDQFRRDVDRRFERVDERFVDVIDRIAGSEIRLRGEMQTMGTELREEMATMRGEMATMETGLRGEMATMGTRLAGEIATIVPTLQAEYKGEVLTAITSQTRTMQVTLISVFVLMSGLVLAIAGLQP